MTQLNRRKERLVKLEQKGLLKGCALWLLRGPSYDDKVSIRQHRSIEMDFNKINHLRERLSVPDGSMLSVYNDCLHEGKLVKIAFWDDYDLDAVYILE